VRCSHFHSPVFLFVAGWITWTLRSFRPEGLHKSQLVIGFVPQGLLCQSWFSSIKHVKKNKKNQLRVTAVEAWQPETLRVQIFLYIWVFEVDVSLPTQLHCLLCTSQSCCTGGASYSKELAFTLYCVYNDWTGMIGGTMSLFMLCL
jgi:hypothetical protein